MFFLTIQRGTGESGLNDMADIGEAGMREAGRLDEAPKAIERAEAASADVVLVPRRPAWLNDGAHSQTP